MLGTSESCSLTILDDVRSCQVLVISVPPRSTWDGPPRHRRTFPCNEALLLALPWPEHLERLTALQAALCSESLENVAKGDTHVAEQCFQDAIGGRKPVPVEKT